MLRVRYALSGLFAVAATLGPVLAAPVWAATGTVNIEIAKITPAHDTRSAIGDPHA